MYTCTCAQIWVGANVSEEHTASIFMHEARPYKTTGKIYSFVYFNHYAMFLDRRGDDTKIMNWMVEFLKFNMLLTSL
jgi:hypothetical protein